MSSENSNQEQNNKIILFKSRTIRREWYENEWYYSLVDIVGALAESANPRDYFKKIRRRDSELNSYVGTNCPHVAMLTESGKKRKILSGNTEHVFRLIQSIPSPKAEPFKLWLAKVGRDRIEEIENPEFAQERMKSLYEQKGYSKEWIEAFWSGVIVRRRFWIL